MRSFWAQARAMALIAIGALIIPNVAPNMAKAADPIRIGMSMALTGGVAPIGKQVLTALQIWRDDVNAKGGLLGRPVELVFYDDQSNPANVPQLYTKLIDVDKVDLVIGPYATNMVAPAIPIMMQHKMTTIGILANAANSKFHYDQYFSMLPTGPEPQKSFAYGFFELAAAATPRPKTVAIVAADAEFAQNAADGARQSIKEIGGFDLVLDQKYPPTTTDYTPIMRAVQALNPDIVFVAAYPPDSVGIVRAAKRNRHLAENVRRHLHRAPGHADQGPARAADERHRQQRSVPAGAEPGVPRHQGTARQVPGRRRDPRHRSGRLGVPAARLCGRPSAGAGGRRHQEPRSTPSSPPTCMATRSRPWSAISPSARTANG